MLLRNSLFVLLTSIVSLMCYQEVQWNRRAGILSEAMTLIERNYFEEVDSRGLFEGAMRGMVGQLDTYSSYISPQDFQEFQDGLNQHFGGIGVLVEMNAKSRRLTVVSPMIDTPAQRAGLRAGDVILAIDGADTTEMTLRDAVERIHGKIGEPIQLRVAHVGESEPVEISVVRAEIKTDSVLGDARRSDAKWDYFLQEDSRIQYLRLITFGERTVEELRSALAQRNAEGASASALIIDLRDNAGGLLTAATGVCDLFLDEGVIVSTRGRHGVEARRFEARPDLAVDKSVPIVVLVNRSSASASEIVAACLQDHHRALIVGERSWGKGTVQNVIPLEGGRSGLKLTTASYWRPSNRNIHRPKDATEEQEWGVKPDEGFDVALTSDLQRKIYQYRRYRDLQVPAEPLAQATTPTPRPVAPESPSPTPPDSNAPGSTAADVTTPLAESPAQDPDRPTPPADKGRENDTEPTEADSGPPAPVDDPQLRKAIEYLRQKIDGKSGAAKK